MTCVADLSTTNVLIFLNDSYYQAKKNKDQLFLEIDIITRVRFYFTFLME